MPVKPDLGALTRDCEAGYAYPKGTSVVTVRMMGARLAAVEEALARCNHDKAAIREVLTSPPPPP